MPTVGPSQKVIGDTVVPSCVKRMIQTTPQKCANIPHKCTNMRNSPQIYVLAWEYFWNDAFADFVYLA